MDAVVSKRAVEGLESCVSVCLCVFLSASNRACIVSEDGSHVCCLPMFVCKKGGSVFLDERGRGRGVFSHSFCLLVAGFFF